MIIEEEEAGRHSPISILDAKYQTIREYQRVNCRMTIKFLVQIRELNHQKKQEQKPQRVKIPPLFKKIKLEMQAFIVLLRYSQFNETGEIKLSYIEIFEIIKVN